VRRLPLLLIGSALFAASVAGGGVARAQPQLGPELTVPEQEVVEQHGVAWPLMLDVHALLGVEPHGERGAPIAFGAGAELLWRARIGGFAELLSSEGTALITPTIGGVKTQGFADRISIPFGLAARPLARWFADRHDWWARLVTGIGVQVGITVEHLRTSDESNTTAGLHAALSLDVPIYGGPKQGGVTLRLAGRLMVTPSTSLDFSDMIHTFTVFEPATAGQLFVGLAYYP